MLENDKVAQSHKANRKLQMKLLKMDQEKNNLEQHIMSLIRLNRNAHSAIVDAKDVYLKLILRTNQLQSEANNH